MNMLKRLLIACHPDRNGGDHSRMEAYYAAAKRDNSKGNVRRCPDCGVRIGGVARHCGIHWRARKAIAATAAACLLAVAAQAQSIRLAWDASTSPGVTNYVLYAHTNTLAATNLSAAVVKQSVGTNLTATIEDIKPGHWWFVATAVGSGVESGPSNSVNVEVPKPPAAMRTIVVQYSGTLTNFYDVGFFRLRLP